MTIREAPKPATSPATSYLNPRLRRARATLSASVRVLAIEVTQAIQSLAHDVRLIAGKRTVVRVYLEASGLSQNLTVLGEIVVSIAPGAPARYITSDNSIVLRADNSPDLAKQRSDAALSLNFVLDQPAGQLHVAVNRVTPKAGGDDVTIAEGAPTSTVQFVVGAPLRVRAVGLRYTDNRTNPPASHAPRPDDFNLLRSFLTRAYPVPQVEWSQIVVSISNFAPPFRGTTLPNGRDPLWEALLQIAHNFMAQLREADIKGGRDSRTHYYGLVSDASDFFRGAANAVPVTPRPETVAVGPAGKPSGSLAWDKDDSYGDWYGAHELAHTFGRHHPGFCGGQGRADTAFPYANGKISNAAEDHVAFDVGDPALGRPMVAYGRDDCHDIMTYCDVQWLSKYTYHAIYDRLALEDALVPATPIA